MAAPPTSPPPYDEKSPRTPRISGTNPLGILNFGTPVKKPRNITKERSRHDTPGSRIDGTTFIAQPDVLKELLPCLAKGWAPEETKGEDKLCGVFALHQAFKNIMGVERAPNGFGFDKLKEGIQSAEFKTFHRNVIRSRVRKTGLRGNALEDAVNDIIHHGNFGDTNNFSIEQLSEFVRYLCGLHNLRYRVGVVSTPYDLPNPGVSSAYIVENDDAFRELHHPVLWLQNNTDSHWESFGPNPSARGRRLRRTWKLVNNVRRVVNNGLYRVKAATEGVPDQYTLTTLVNQWLYQVAPPQGLDPRDGFIYVHTTKGPNSDSWRVAGVSNMDTIRNQEGFVPLANLEAVDGYIIPEGRGPMEYKRVPTDFQAQREGLRTPPPPPPGGAPPTPGPTPGGEKGPTTTGPTQGGKELPVEGQTPMFKARQEGPRTPPPPPPRGAPPTPAPTPGGEELPVKGQTKTGQPGTITDPPIQLPPTPGPDIPITRGPIVPTNTQTEEPQAKQPEPPVVHIPEPPVIPQPTPPPAPRPKVIGPNTPLTIQTFLQRRPFGPSPSLEATRSESLGARPRLPPGRPKGRTMAEFTAMRNRKNDWQRTQFLNFFVADVPDEDATGERFGPNHDQPYHQDQVLLGLDETYEPDQLGPVRVRTIDEDEGWAHSANLRKVTDPFGLDVNAGTTQYSMDPNEAFREDLYSTSVLRGMCQGSGIDPAGRRQDLMARLAAHRMGLGVPLILYRLVEAVGVFAKDDLVRVPGDPLASPEQYFRAFGLEPHQRGYVKGENLVAEPRSWGARVRPHVHGLKAPYGLKWALPPSTIEDLVRAGSNLSLHGVDTLPGGEKAAPEETEDEREEREAGFAPAATVIPLRHPGQRETTKDGSPTFFTRLPPSQTGQTGQTGQTSSQTVQPAQESRESQTGQTSQTAQVPRANLANRTTQPSQAAQTSRGKRGAEEDTGGDGSRRRVSQRSQG
ncbi:hypothetical protein V496_08300 [Pseudogymnoascus sp. VKM F-4515 (FW-2607)]|nr:hypothetical protein V496_08300 [Pseudogymnoascus sp. VKM F-4515 (FW-2607)]